MSYTTIDLSRTKKRLKKELDLKGLNISLSEVAELLARSLGFKNEHEMQQQIKKENKEKTITGQKFVFSISESEKVVELIQAALSKDSGNVIIAGSTGSGKTTLLEKIKRHPQNKLVSFESIVEYSYKSDSLNNAVDVATLKNNHNKICTLHIANNIENIQKRLSLFLNHNINLKNDLNIKAIIFLDEQQQIFVRIL